MTDKNTNNQIVKLSSSTIGRYSNALVRRAIDELSKSPINQIDNLKIGDNVLVKAIPSKQHLHQEESLNIDYKLYTRVSVTGYQILKEPIYKGFQIKDLDIRNQHTDTETMNGKQYRVITKKKVVLFAMQSGNMKITPLEVRVSINVLFKQQGTHKNVQEVETVIKSNSLEINVEKF